MLASGPPELAGSSVLSFESTNAEQQVEGDDRTAIELDSPSDPTPLPSAESQSSHVAATELLVALHWDSRPWAGDDERTFSGDCWARDPRGSSRMML
jgi:hypothetical protein